MRKKKKSLFIKWLLTYMFLIAISLLFIFSVRYIYNRNIKQDINALNQAYLQQTMTVFGNQLNSIDRLVYALGNDADINKIIAMDASITSSDRYIIMNTAKSLSLFAQSSAIIQRIDFYAQNPNMIISEKSAYHGQYIELYANSYFGVGSSILKNVVHQNNRMHVSRFNDLYAFNSSDNPLVYIQSIPVQINMNSRGALIIVFDEKRLENYGKMDWIEEGKLLVFNENQELVFTNDQELYHNRNLMDIMDNVGLQEITINNAMYIKHSIVSEDRGWTYVSLVPQKNYYQRSHQLGNIIMVMTVVFLLINILIAYYFTYKMYKPVKKIITSYGEEEVMIESEYEYIDTLIKKNIHLQEKMQHSLYKQEKPLKNALLTKMLKGYANKEAYVEKELERFNLYLGEKGFRLVYIDYRSENEEKHDGILSQFIIHNIFEELLKSYYICHVIDIDNSVAIIVNIDVDSIMLNEIEDEIEVAIDMIAQNFGLKCLLGVSENYQSATKLSKAYEESIEALVHSSILEGRRILYYQSNENFITQYHYTTEEEYKLIHYLMTGNLEQAITLIDQVLMINIKENQMRLGYIQCLMYDLLGAVIKSMKETAVIEGSQMEDPVRQMMLATNIDEMRAVIIHAATLVCESHSLDGYEQSSKEVEADINQFILEHYQDSNLNVSKIGEAFHMTPAYLSKLYSKETGNSILYYLNYVRIEAAKKLLEETDLSINEISEKVGYLYTSAFIRFFKNQVGTTPGRYKTIKNMDS